LLIERRFDTVSEEGPQGVGVMIALIARLDRLSGRAHLAGFAGRLPVLAQLPGDAVDEIGEDYRSSPLPVGSSTVVAVPRCPALGTPRTREIPVNRHIPGDNYCVLQVVSISHGPTPL